MRRAGIEKTLLRGFCWLNATLTGTPQAKGLYRTSIWGGPLRGMNFSTSRLERASFALGSYEPHVVQVLQAHIKPGMVAYDVGANAGYLSLIMSRLAGPQGHVYSFEPDPKNIQALRANVVDNHLSNVEIIPKAVSNECGTISLATYDYSLISHIVADGKIPASAQLVQVPVISLDSFVYTDQAPRPGFIKIDVEGGEQRVFMGAARLIEEARPVIVAEIRGGSIWQNISAFMKARGYESQALEGAWQLDVDNLGDILFYPLTRDEKSIY
jgi:FkbM family methyltransferase